jgi:hypothetical protein
MMESVDHETHVRPSFTGDSREYGDSVENKLRNLGKRSKYLKTLQKTERIAGYPKTRSFLTTAWIGLLDSIGEAKQQTLRSLEIRLAQHGERGPRNTRASVVYWGQ